VNKGCPYGWAALALAILALSLAGCGGGPSKAAYMAGLAKIRLQGADFKHALAARYRQATTVPEITAVVREFARVETRAGDEVSRLQPPSDAAAANTALARGLHDDAATFTALLPRLSRSRTIQEAAGVLQDRPMRGDREIIRAFSTLTKLGYAAPS